MTTIEKFLQIMETIFFFEGIVKIINQLLILQGCSIISTKCKSYEFKNH